MGKNTVDLTVLHDWDDPNPNRRRGFLVEAVLSLKVGLAVRVPFLREVFHEAYQDACLMKVNYLNTLLRLNELAGVTSIIGLKDDVAEKYPEILDVLRASEVDVRLHSHIGEDFKNMNRKRTWDPPLNQPSYTWHYDTKWVNGKQELLKQSDTYPIWHVDHIQYLQKYIEFLHKTIINGVEIYECF